MLGDVLAWIFGSISNIFWLCVYLPQIRENYKNKSCDAMSFYFILLWFIGDTLSSLSAIYKKVSFVIWFISLYNVMFDIIFVCQYVYYTFYDLFFIDEYETHSLVTGLNNNRNVFNYTFYFMTNLFQQREILLLVLYLIVIIFIDMILHLTHISEKIIGEIYGWVIIFIFLSSRIPQIYLNYKRRSVRGLSWLTFSSIILANYFFLASILIKIIDLQAYQRSQYILLNLQWIMGCSITSLLDLVIMYQFINY